MTYNVFGGTLNPAQCNPVIWLTRKPFTCKNLLSVH